jgi:LAO/AO transport system kinase
LTTKPAFKDFTEQIPQGNIVLLAQAITLAESTRKEDRTLAESLIEYFLPHTGRAIRIGITGVPGVGKSTFIEAFGKHLTSLNKRVAILAVDPSSTKTRGSILGDKTRMEELAKDPLAYIRPTATGAALGGVADNTREAMLLCEAAGFDVIIIETVGVGQSETSVRHMVDFFLLLMLPGAGDELQGIKKGIMEMADAIVINKADGDNIKMANRARTDFQYALHLFSLAESGWSPKVLTASSIERTGIAEVWELILEYSRFTNANGYFQLQRKQQDLAWFRESMQHLITQRLVDRIEVREEIKLLETQIMDKKILSSAAANKIVNTFLP